MRIWLVNPFEPLPGAGFAVGRYRALARELAGRGHEVCWWSTDFFHFGKQYRASSSPSEADPYQIRLVHAPAYHDNQSVMRVVSHGTLTLRTLAAMSKVRPRGELILASAPPVELAAGLVSFGQRHGIPVCLDVTDIWPDSFELVFPERLEPVKGLLLQPHRRLMRYALQQCTAISSVSQTYLDWALSLRGQREVRTRLVPWAAPKASETATAPSTEQGPFQATFCGTFGVTYDFDLMLAGARWLHEHHPNQFMINLVGDGPRRPEVIDKIASPNVRVLGPMGEVERNQMLVNSAAGLCCYIPQAPQSLPIKLFDYLSFGLPVINTLSGELRTFLEQHGAGVTVSGAEQLGRALCDLRDDPESWSRMSRAAAQYSEQHTLEHESVRLADFLDRL